MNDIDKPRCPCIIFGTRTSARHFPAETLRIVSNQPLKGKAPTKVVSEMINRALETPRKSREKIAADGLKLLRLKPLAPLLVRSKVRNTSTDE